MHEYSFIVRLEIIAVSLTFKTRNLGKNLQKKNHSEILKPKLTPHQNNTFSLD